MVEEEEEVYEEIMEDGSGVLAEAFMANVVINGPGGKNEEPICLIWCTKMSWMKMICLISSNLAIPSSVLAVYQLCSFASSG